MTHDCKFKLIAFNLVATKFLSFEGIIFISRK